jgi:hypothetical protein
VLLRLGLRGSDTVLLLVVSTRAVLLLLARLCAAVPLLLLLLLLLLSIRRLRLRTILRGRSCLHGRHRRRRLRRKLEPGR